jgi:hypothetical protein
VNKQNLHITKFQAATSLFARSVYVNSVQTGSRSKDMVLSLSQKSSSVKKTTMEKTASWETDSRSTTQHIPRLLWNKSLRHRVHARGQLVPVLSHMSPDPRSFTHFYKIHSSIILPCRPRVFLPSGFPITQKKVNKNSVVFETVMPVCMPISRAQTERSDWLAGSLF